jgi:peptidoglycan/xylan/chitin deacetylase (PgdA/CDA1 family)
MIFPAQRALALLLTAIFTIMPLSVGATDAAPVIRAGSDESPRIALTFDDGPHPKKTDKILDLLQEYDIHATFFVIGQNAVYYPEPLKRTASLGHEIGNHTFRHEGISAMSELMLEKELRDTEKIIFELTDTPVRLFRPPEGACSENVLAAAKNEEYPVILWTVDTRDWAFASTEKIVKTVESKVRNGSILLFHDYTSPGAHTLEALKILIPKLIDEGYEFVTVSELLGE